MEIIKTCPLGHQCEEIRDGKKYVCQWYVRLRGKDPQSDQEIDDDRCAIAWSPLLAIEHSLFERQTGAAVESFRNEMVRQQDKLLQNIKDLPDAHLSLEKSG